MYEKMLVIRKMESAAASLYRENIIHGFLHLYSGEEATAVGVRSAVRDGDSVITAYRCHGWTYLMGISVAGILCELGGRKTGSSRGKGGSMHMYTKNLFGGNGIVGAQTPVGTGLALKHKYSGDGRVSFTLYGDGAANQGQLSEAFNIAKLWGLPVLFICENNGFGMGTAAARAAACTDFYTRGAYIPGIWADGMDVLATREAARFGVEYCTSGKGPIIIELETYRYYGHSMSDPGTSYRTREEIQEMRTTRDPITSFKQKIISNELATPDQLKKIDLKVRQVIDEGVKLARTDAKAGPEELAADIYSDCKEPYIRNILPNKPLKHTAIAKRN